MPFHLKTKFTNIKQNTIYLGHKLERYCLNYPKYIDKCQGNTNHTNTSYIQIEILIFWRAFQNQKILNFFKFYATESRATAS